MKKREIRKFIVMIMGIILLVSEVQLFSGDNVYASTKTSRYEQLYVPSWEDAVLRSGIRGSRRAVVYVQYIYKTSEKNI